MARMRSSALPFFISDVSVGLAICGVTTYTNKRLPRLSVSSEPVAGCCSLVLARVAGADAGDTDRLPGYPVTETRCQLRPLLLVPHRVPIESCPARNGR